MSNLISREDAVEEIARRDTTDGTVKVFSGREVIDLLNGLPAESKEEYVKIDWKMGKWIYDNDLKLYFCSECQYRSLSFDDVYIYGMDMPNFCENCGARMETEETE